MATTHFMQFEHQSVEIWRSFDWNSVAHLWGTILVIVAGIDVVNVFKRFFILTTFFLFFNVFIWFSVFIVKTFIEDIIKIHKNDLIRYSYDSLDT